MKKFSKAFLALLTLTQMPALWAEADASKYNDLVSYKISRQLIQQPIAGKTVLEQRLLVDNYVNQILTLKDEDMALLENPKSCTAEYIAKMQGAAPFAAYSLASLKLNREAILKFREVLGQTNKTALLEELSLVPVSPHRWNDTPEGKRMLTYDSLSENAKDLFPVAKDRLNSLGVVSLHSVGGYSAAINSEYVDFAYIQSLRKAIKDVESGEETVVVERKDLTSNEKTEFKITDKNRKEVLAKLSSLERVVGSILIENPDLIPLGLSKLLEDKTSKPLLPLSGSTIHFPTMESNLAVISLLKSSVCRLDEAEGRMNLNVHSKPKSTPNVEAPSETEENPNLVK